MRHLLNAREITIKHSKKTLLDKVSFALKEHDKAVIVGRNGSGKTTLLTILAGENEIDDGELVFAGGITVGYLPQEFSLPKDLTIHEVLQQEYNKKHVGSWLEDHLVSGLLLSFALPEFTSKISTLSGGQHRRVALLKALLLEPDILLLDEPTNHLDLEMIKSLEIIIREYPHSCVVISHDRYFVDRIATKIIEIDNKQLHIHKGGYKDFLYSRETRISNNEKAEEKKQDFLRREVEWVHAGVRARSTKSKSRLKAYYDLKKEEVFKRHIDPSLLIPTPPDLGSKVLRAHNITVEIGNKQILKNFSFKFEAGFKLGLIGPNGSGKTTLLKTITGERKPAMGKVAIGDSTIINYHDQNRQHLSLNKSILDEIAGGAERIEFGTGSINSYSYLKRFLFNSEQIRTSIQNLSGGEKARVLLAKLFKISSNFLILDEPTNDLDIETLGVLEQSLQEYSGCMILVSHDRYFLNSLCTHVLSLEGDGSFILSTGNYDDFLRKYKTDSGELELVKEEIEAAPKASIPTKIIAEETTKLTNQETRSLKKELARLENQIEILEQQIKDKETKFTDPEFFKRENLNNFVFGIGRDKKQLEVFQTRWLEIGELLGI